MKQYTLKIIHYEEARLQYYQDQIKACEQSIRWWKTIAPSRGYCNIEISDKCSELGWRINFYRDAINALYGDKDVELNF